MERHARKNRSARLLGLVLGLACCDREPAVSPTAAPETAAQATPPAGPALRPEPLQVTAPTAPAPTAPAPTAPAPTAPGAPAKHPATCEVEIGGLVKLPGGKMPAPNTVFVYVADGDCMADGAHILGRMAVAINSAYFVEVFSRWGADLSVCAAVETGPGPKEKQPSRVYGKAPGKLHTEADGEVGFPKVNIELKPGPPHVFPAAKP